MTCLNRPHTFALAIGQKRTRRHTNEYTYTTYQDERDNAYSIANQEAGTQNKTCAAGKSIPGKRRETQRELPQTPR
ncbi:hypothetical protein BHU16_10070 [Tannerella sp. oral taxon 808]|nr:hypothetical protein BHU16_10070 [Tannerella sp. oral taxon 808]